MIDLLAEAIRFAIEVVGQSVISVPIELVSARKKGTQHPTAANPLAATSILLLLVGGMLGWVSAAVLPILVHAPILRIAGILISPLLAGAVGYRIARWRAWNINPLIVPRYHFWYSFSFTFGLACVRFAYGK